MQVDDQPNENSPEVGRFFQARNPPFPRYDIGVPQETPQHPEAHSSLKPESMVPMSPEDFARRKRKVVFAWLGVGLIIILLGGWIYKRSSDSQELQQVFNDGAKMLKASRYAEAVQS